VYQWAVPDFYKAVRMYPGKKAGRIDIGISPLLSLIVSSLFNLIQITKIIKPELKKSIPV
jgi:hypothetical protein